MKLKVEAIIWRDAFREQRKPLKKGLIRLLSFGVVVDEDDEAVYLATEVEPGVSVVKESENLDHTGIPKPQILDRKVVGSVEVKGEKFLRRKRRAVSASPESTPETLATSHSTSVRTTDPAE